MTTDERVIRCGECYPLEEFKRRAGWSQSAYRAAKRQGLRVTQAGKRVFVSGDEFLRYLNAIGQSENAAVVAGN